MTKKVYLLKEAIGKLEHYCAYQDRCYKEVESKMFQLQIGNQIKDAVLLHLIEHDFLNEERYARSFVRGKFRIKKWGKVRIKQELKFRNISDYLVRIALTEIEDSEYLETLDNLISKKHLEIREENSFKKRQKVFDFALRKGFESSLILEILNSSDYNK